MKKYFTKAQYNKPRTAFFVAALSVVVASFIFAFRYKAALTSPNFYAEDGSIFAQNIFQHNVFGAALTAFNGYLVTGQYMVADVGFLVYRVFGLPFSALPLLFAISSCLFLGATAALPFILFRKELGWPIALSLVLLTAFIPLPSSDYAVIGTIGNLKFLFLYWAFLFIIYRHIHLKDKLRVYLSDIILFLCVITNGPVVFLLPIILISYRKEIATAIHKRSVSVVLKSKDMLSGVALMSLSALYVLVVLVKGIPKIPNYLTDLYQWEATAKILYRVTIHAWLYPISQGMHDYMVYILLLVLLVWVFYANKQRRAIFLFGLYAIFIATISFVATRTGIAAYMLTYKSSPDQFFYTQGMIFVFISIWTLAPYINKTKQTMRYYLLFVAIFLLCAVPFASSYGKNLDIYKAQGTIYQNISRLCNEGAANSKDVVLPIYPTSNWTWTVPRTIACK